MNDAYFIGIDLGTQGLRVVVLDVRGSIVAGAEQGFPLSPGMRMEQDPDEWWRICRHCLDKAIGRLSAEQRARVLAIAVDSTSGTVIPMDKTYRPLHPAIMYSDQRSGIQAKKCTAAAQQYHPQGFTGFSTSTGLAKMVWFAETFPEKAAQIFQWIHAADFITGKLCGVWNVTDYTNVLKSGYDLTLLNWPDYIHDVLGVRKEWLQEVQPSGTVIGTLKADLVRDLELPDHVAVTTGITDGCASQVASGAMKPGQWNTTIGTTLVIKGVSVKEINDPLNRLYNHRHPAGYWMPGGAGNIGADWVAAGFRDALEHYNTAAAALTPTGKIAYPLIQKGERFPFVAPEAEGFAPDGVSGEVLYTANMEGVAFAERYAYEMIRSLSGENVEAIYTAGGASNSDTWLQIRSDILQKPVCKMKYVSGAVGAAIVAASTTCFNDISEATAALTQAEKWVTPGENLKQQYEDQYGLFLKTMKARGFINE
ncbi:FGGY-family carbohydrate kinase [Niabella drilacis]|uniref:Sugar (Pentulose or hexulose) kinase n=1 Tax=Niabella drilacis (strain DSM 25811 / CCM 8410 / CCUG 62505 / LMG 26954 / E90) TaxID=1285928 RepID=A0A1G6HXT7_NIADE|nr:FGGY-family carbohydrate kinase [Niabella drilacis]SDB98963.1 Sugar (pentulose or hexulose) kinase [Niabella drilacis]